MHISLCDAGCASVCLRACVRLLVSIDCCAIDIEGFFFSFFRLALKAVLLSVERLKAMTCVIDGTSL